LNAVERAPPPEARTEIVMKVKLHPLLFNPAVWMMALIENVVSAKNRQASKVSTRTSRGVILFFLALLACATLAPAQSSSQIGLPVIFVHGFCDKADSFLQDEEAVKATLQSHYSTQYPTAQAPNSDEYITFYDGTTVWFQLPTKDVQDPESPNPIVTVPSSTRFFVVALDDPSQHTYELFDPSTVADIPIYTKGNELARIIWQIKAITGAPRVIVVGHSMGGLDARSYIEG
jgi:triacylglycerol esterase/lipase EstA (alpha/beta hydrolase family)